MEKDTIIKWISLLGILIINGKEKSILEILLGLELISLSSNIIASSYKNASKRNYMGVIKYMIMSSISSGIIIIGIAINNKMSPMVTIIGLVYKLGVIGNHNWIKDIYNRIEIKSLIWITGITKLGVLILLVGLSQDWGIEGIGEKRKLLLIIGIGSIIIGTLLALIEKKIFKLLGYSSINHTGWILLGKAVEEKNIEGTNIYIIQYIISTIIILGLLNRSIGEKCRKYEEITKVNLTIVILSLSGIRPFIGFYSKQIILLEMLNNQLYLAILTATLCSMIGIIYYLRIIKRIWFKNGDKVVEPKMWNKNEWCLNKPIVDGSLNQVWLLTKGQREGTQIKKLEKDEALADRYKKWGPMVSGPRDQLKYQTLGTKSVGRPNRNQKENQGEMVGWSTGKILWGLPPIIFILKSEWILAAIDII